MDIVKQYNQAESRVGQGKEKLIKRLLTPTPVFKLIASENKARVEAEEYIKKKFRSSYNAKVDEFYPILISMKCLNKISGVAGLRVAEDDTLFLEKYLVDNIEDTIERIVEKKGEKKIERAGIVEIGNLVASAKGASQIIFIILTSVLFEAGYQWIVFTATKSLQNNLVKLGFETTKIKTVNSNLLSNDELRKWGEYYETNPAIMVGELTSAMTAIEKSLLFRRVRFFYKNEIEKMKKQIIK